MLKIGQNWGKMQIIPPNAQQRSAPLIEKEKILIFCGIEFQVLTPCLRIIAATSYFS